MASRGARAFCVPALAATAVVLALLAPATASGGGRRLLDAAAAGSTTSLQPFTALDVGYRAGCFPFSVIVAPGREYAVSVQGPGADTYPTVGAVVDGRGTCSLKVLPPGVRNAAGLNITVTVPDGALASVLVGDSANVLLLARPAATFSVTTSGQGWLKAAGGSADAVTVSASGMGPTLLCGPPGSAEPWPQSLTVRNSGTGAVVVAGASPARTSAQLSGTGPVHVSGPPRSGASAQLTLSGSAPLVASGEEAYVSFNGMGDVWVAGATHVTGVLSGIGHVHVPRGAGCELQMQGIGGCTYDGAYPPPPPLRCDDFSAADVADANAAAWTVDVSDGGSCSSHRQAAGGGADADADAPQHGHKVANPCCSTAYSISGSHCETNGMHHQCCIDKGEWTCTNATAAAAVSSSSSSSDADAELARPSPNGNHGRRVPNDCCSTGYVHSGTHCETDGVHHACCVEHGVWTCDKRAGGVLAAVTSVFAKARAAVAKLLGAGA